MSPVPLVPLVLGLALTGPARPDGLELDESLFFGSWSPHATRYVVRAPVCAWSSSPDRRYRVIADVVESPGRFALLGDVGARIGFALRWRDADATARWDVLSAGLASEISYRFDDAPGCPGGATELQIKLSVDDADAAPGGVYTATLSITIVSE